MYRLNLGPMRVECDTASEVRALADGHAPIELARRTRPKVKRIKRKAKVSAAGEAMRERWARANAYARKHGIAPMEAMKELSKSK